jgi:hypothetical protein
MKRGSSGGVRLLSLLILVIFTLGGIRPAWSCPSQAGEPSCCCEPAEPAPPPPEEAQLAPACCCEATPASEGTAPTPTVAVPSHSQDTLAPAIPLATLLPAPLVLVENLPPIDLGDDKVPPRTLLHLRTLLLC